MSLTFTQTDTTLTASYTQCQTAADDPADISVKKDAEVGGSAGSSEGTITINKGDVETGYFVACGSAGGIDDSTWRGGGGEAITAYLNVTSSNTDLTCTAVYACRISSGGTSQGTYGTWTGSTSMGSTGSKSFSLTTTGQSASAGDWLLLL